MRVFINHRKEGMIRIVQCPFRQKRMTILMMEKS